MRLQFAVISRLQVEVSGMYRLTKSALIFTVLGMVLLMPTGCKRTVETPAEAPSGIITESQYSQISRGMTKQAVLDKLGQPYTGTDMPVWMYSIDYGNYKDTVSIFWEEGHVRDITRQ